MGSKDDSMMGDDDDMSEEMGSDLPDRDVCDSQTYECSLGDMKSGFNPPGEGAGLLCGDCDIDGECFCTCENNYDMDMADDDDMSEDECPEPMPAPSTVSKRGLISQGDLMVAPDMAKLPTECGPTFFSGVTPIFEVPMECCTHESNVVGIAGDNW